jgi:cystinosin
MAFYCSEREQKVYVARNDGHRAEVEPQDVFCSLLTTAAIAVTVAQCYVYPPRNRGVAQATSLTIRGAFVVAAAITTEVVLAICWRLTGFQNHLSILELGTTVGMHVPQLLLNLRRKSTTGWSVYSVHLDTSSRLFWVIGDWSVVTGSPVKLLLAAIDLSANGVYLMQHYVWYASESAGHEALPLLVKRQPPASAKIAPIASHASPSWLTLVALHGTDGLAMDKTFWHASAELRHV